MLCDLLRDRIGSQNAVPLNDISDFIGLSRRATERLIEFHLPDLPFCVVADAGGYYRPSTPDEINHYRKTLLSRIKRLASRYRTITNLAIKDGWPKLGEFVKPSVAPLLTSMDTK
jgi:hypothetical protein